MSARFTLDRMREVVRQLGDEDRDLLTVALDECAVEWEAAHPRRELAPVKQRRRWTAFLGAAHLAAFFVALTFLAVAMGFDTGTVWLIAGLEVLALGAVVLDAILEDSRRMKYWMRGMVPPDR